MDQTSDGNQKAMMLSCNRAMAKADPKTPSALPESANLQLSANEYVGALHPLTLPVAVTRLHTYLINKKLFVVMPHGPALFELSRPQNASWQFLSPFPTKHHP